MTKTFIIENGQKLTQEQLKEIEEAQNSPVVFDEDCEFHVYFPFQLLHTLGVDLLCN